MKSGKTKQILLTGGLLTVLGLSSNWSPLLHRSDSATSLSILLNDVGYEVRTAEDGMQALETAANFRPDIALLDIGMPKLNGYEVARQLRQQPWGREVLLIAVTGWGGADHRQQTAQAGFDHHLTKPVDPAALTRLLVSLLTETGPRARGSVAN